MKFRDKRNKKEVTAGKILEAIVFVLLSLAGFIALAKLIG